MTRVGGNGLSSDWLPIPDTAAKWGTHPAQTLKCFGMIGYKLTYRVLENSSTGGYVTGLISVYVWR